MAEAGWYPDTVNAGWLAYWDGQRWTGDRRQSGDQAQQQYWQQQPHVPAEQTQTPVEQTQAPAEQTQAPAEQTQAPAEQTQRIDRSTLPAESQGASSWEQGRQAQPGWGQQQPTSQYPAAQPDQQPAGWQQAAGWPQQTPPPGGWQQQPRWDEPQPPERRRSRKPLIIAGAAVIVLVAGLVTWLVWPSEDAPSLTYDGKQIADAAKTLSTAEDSVQATVKSRHGVADADTRCYFAQAKKAPKGQKASDIEQGLRCGPVLFVDGDKSREYLSVPLTSKAATGNKVELTSSSSLDSLQPQAVSDDLKLSRPDGKSAPGGAGGLTPPRPPAAESTLLAVADLGPTAEPKSLPSSAVMVGRDTKVSVQAAGYIDRYGAGDDARSAPSGMKLVAFQVDYGEGDVSGTSSTRAQLVVAGGGTRELPDSDSSDWIVAAVPTSGAQLQLSDGGFKQTLTLPDGKPGSGNIAVLRRTHRSAFITRSFSVPVRLTRSDGASANVTLRGRVSFVSLDFWAQQNTSVHASSPQNGLLGINPLFTVTGSTKTYGFDPGLIKLRVTGGRQVGARNIATGGKIYNVFEVPAAFTSGVFTVSGAEKIGNIRLTVRKAYSFTVSIPAG